MAHDDDVDRGQGIGKEAARLELHAVLQSMRGDVFFEDRLDGRKVKSDSLQVRIRKGDLHGRGSLGATHVGESLVILPRKLLRHHLSAGDAQAGHRFQELTQAGGVGVEFREVVHSVFAFILRFAGAQGFGEICPEAKKTGAEHF